MHLKDHPVELGPALSLKAGDALLVVDVQPGDGQRALAQMLQPGAQAVTLKQIRVAS